MIFKKDELFSAGDYPKKFIFDNKVADVFPDMLNRSIPAYMEVIKNISVIANKYAKDNSTIYDLGCSLGAVTFALRHNIKKKIDKIISVDNSPAMIDRFKNILTGDSGKIPVVPICKDIRDCDIKNASVVIMNYTMQFLDRRERDLIVKKIYNGLVDNGILIVSEKVFFNNDSQTMISDEIYYEFKKFMGYNELEISRKRDALENVLIRDSIEDHKKRFLSAGFNECFEWFRMYNFSSFLCIK